MRISSWNIRGLGDSDKCSLLKVALLASRSSVVCLQESKLQEVDRRKAATFLPQCLRSVVYMPASGSSGGTIVAWNDDDLQGVEIAKNRFCITIHQQSRGNNDFFFLGHLRSL